MLPALAGLTLVATAGCADDVSPAARVDGVAIPNDELLDEVEKWGNNSKLLQAVQFPEELAQGEAPESWSTELVGFVLGSRVGFELHRAEFEELGLELDDEQREGVRGQLFGDPAVTEQVFEGFTDDYGDELVDSVAARSQCRTSSARSTPPGSTRPTRMARSTSTPATAPGTRSRAGSWPPRARSPAPPNPPSPPADDPRQ